MSLEARSVTLTRGGTTILDNVCATASPGRMTAIVGPNGAGKSSLLRILSGEITESNGAISLEGTPLSDVTIAKQAFSRSVLLQSSHVVFDFSVEEVLRLGWVQGDEWGADAVAHAMHDVTSDCDISHLLHRTFNTLSSGEQQRVQFARALLQIWQPSGQAERRYLLLDEPTSNLDLAHELLVMRLARRALERNVAVLIVVHDLNLAARFCDEIVLMHNGRVVAVGKPESVLTAETLTEVYGTDIRVEWHDALERLVIFS